MTTVQALIDRTYRQILEPPDAQPPTSRLVSGILDTDQTLDLTVFDIPEDENLLRLGSIIEIDSELMRVVAFNTSTREVSVLREYLGSAAAPHAEGAQVKLSPPYPRMDVFSAISEYLFAQLNSDTRSSPALAELLSKGKLGVKSGAGFYKYPGKELGEIVRRRDRLLLQFLRALDAE